MKNQENKKNKKKILLSYLILAACLLVIAAVTVTVIFTLRTDGNLTIDVPNQEEPDDPPVEEQPTDTTDEFILPVKQATVTSTHATFRYDVSLQHYSEHTGMDFEGEVGDEVYAVRNGTVKEVVTGDKLFANYVVLEHDNGVTTTYMYIDIADGLKVGDTVSRGDVIGTIAEASGAEFNQGAHLHFELCVDNVQKDPSDYLDVDEK